MSLAGCIIQRAETRKKENAETSKQGISMSPKLHLEPAFLCIALHKNKKCKKSEIQHFALFCTYLLCFPAEREGVEPNS